MANEVISAKNLTKQYGDFTAVKGVTFSIKEGGLYGLLGPNGAGKSTLIRMLYRVSPATSGELSLFGIKAGEDDREIKARLGVVPQVDNLDEDLDVKENLVVYGRYNDLSSKEAEVRAEELLEFVELSHKKHALIRELSGGMKRRLTLARGLVNDPEVLILDEPTTGLDPQVKITLWKKLEQLRKSGVTILMSTHYMDEAEKLCNKIFIMDKGEIIREGEPSELVKAYISPEVLEVRLDGREPDLVLSLANKYDIEAEGEGTNRILLFTREGGSLREEIQKLDGGYHCHLRPGNLEDVFLYLTGKELRE